MNCKEKDLLLYAVTDRHWLGEGEPLIHQVEQAVRGGATFVQLREKELDEASFEAEGREILELCRKQGIPFVINDNVELAVRIGADGVHVGQSDMEAGHVRELIGPDRILGVSAETVEAAIRAEQAGADYLGCGAVFVTHTKKDTVPLGLDGLKAVRQAVRIPIAGIAGITTENYQQVLATGADGVAVVSGILGAASVRGAVNRFLGQ